MIFLTTYSTLLNTHYLLMTAIYIAEELTKKADLLQTAIKYLQHYSSSIGFKFPSSETQCKIFNNNKNNNDIIYNVYLNNYKIEYTKCIYILGLIFDSKSANLHGHHILKNLKSNVKIERK